MKFRVKTSIIAETLSKRVCPRVVLQRNSNAFKSLETYCYGPDATFTGILKIRQPVGCVLKAVTQVTTFRRT